MSSRSITYSEALNEALHEEMERDSNVFVLGEDIGVLGGLFQVTKGLLDQFGAERVIDTPISEAAIAGAGVGAAMAGARPVIEFQFNDFMTIAMDQIVNHAAKLRYMTGGQAQIPLVIRTAICSGIGMGAQHSQSLEAWFAHVPGLVVVMPSTPYAAKGLLKAAIRDPNPVVVLEPRLLYTTTGEVPDQEYLSRMPASVVHREGRDVTIVATGRMVGVAISAATKLSRNGIEAEVVDPQTLKPLDTETILESVRKTGRVVIANEGSRSCGYAAEIAAVIAELAFEYLDAPIQRVTSKDVPMPVSRVLEKEILPDQNAVLAAVDVILA